MIKYKENKGQIKQQSSSCMHYHSNAKTNIFQRQMIKEKRSIPNRMLAQKFCVSHTTISKWKNANHTKDLPSRPRTIHYALTKDEERIIVKVRDKGFFLNELLEALAPYIERLNRSNCYRTLLRYKRNRFTDKEKRKIKKFAQYEPGFLHIDVFYLPKIGEKGKKKRYYCFLAIDRATRMLFLEIYPHKGTREAGDFLMKCLNFFPFQIRFVLTDNGKEFVVCGKRNRFGKIEKKNLFEAICSIAGIEHRKTKVKHPWTNGLAEIMVRTIKENTTKITRYQNIFCAIQDFKKFQDYHNYQRKLKVLQNLTPYDKMMEWYRKKSELFMYHSADSSNFWKERGETKHILLKYGESN
jgi:transposase-like protein